MTDLNIFKDKKVAYYTLGCKLNFAEMSAVGKELSAIGIRKAAPGEQADFCIVNTCSVTELSDKKSRQLIRRIHKTYPDACLIVTGCYAQLKPEETAQIDGVDLVLGAEQKQNIVHYITQIIQNGKAERPSSNMIAAPAKEIQTFVPSCSADDRTRYFLKVQDGCDYYCTYCTIPMARGRSRNGAIADIVKQAEQVADSGGREIVLTGVNIGDFGKSTGEQFINLLKALDETAGIERFRLSSVEPNLLTDEIIAFIATSKRFMPHFHLPLQSGSDAVLQLMRRRYDTALFRSRTERIRTLMPHAFIGVDVIVGTRGETDDLFADSLSFIDSLPVSQLHVFTYSERPNTQALKITPITPPEVRRERSKELLTLSEKKWQAFYEAHIGKRTKVLFEHAKKGKFMYGFTDNYIKTETVWQKALGNRICEIETTGWNSDKTALIANIIENRS